MVSASESWQKFAEKISEVEQIKYIRSATEIRKCGSITGNKKEIKICLDNPDKVYYTMDHDGKYYEYPKLPVDGEEI